MQISSNQKSISPMLLVGGLIAFAIVWFAFYAFANQSGSLAVSQTAAVTAEGGKGKAQTYGAAFNLTITGTQDGGQCNYKGFWSDGTQEGSGYPQPCNEEGYQNYLKHLFDTKKITEALYNALKEVKFW